MMLKKPNREKFPHPKRTKLLVSIVVTCSVLLAFIVGYVYFSNHKKAPSQTEINTAQIQSSKDRISKDGGSKDQPGSTSNLPSESENKVVEDVPIAENIQVSVEKTNQNNKNVYASANITGSNKSGTCVFTFTKDGDRPIVRQVSSNNSACSVIVPEVEFALLGEWKLNVVFYINNLRAEANSNVQIN